MNQLDSGLSDVAMPLFLAVLAHEAPHLSESWLRLSNKRRDSQDGSPPAEGGTKIVRQAPLEVSNKSKEIRTNLSLDGMYKPQR